MYTECHIKNVWVSKRYLYTTIKELIKYYTPTQLKQVPIKSDYDCYEFETIIKNSLQDVIGRKKVISGTDTDIAMSRLVTLVRSLIEYTPLKPSHCLWNTLYNIIIIVPGR